MANYIITTEWKKLSEILGENYDNTKQYRLHNNVEWPAKLCLSEGSTNIETYGRIYPAYSEIYIDEGCDPSLKVITGLRIETGFNVEISEVGT